MRKRLFRSRASSDDKSPDYPTLDRFEHNRRDFMVRLGGALLGAGALGAGLAACDDRALTQEPDGHLAGAAPVPDARVDQSGPSGAAPSPDAGVDLTIESGAAPSPDAQIDATMTGGKIGPPDAQIDKKDVNEPSPGFAPQMDAMIDEDH